MPTENTLNRLKHTLVEIRTKENHEKSPSWGKYEKYVVTKKIKDDEVSNFA